MIDPPVEFPEAGQGRSSHPNDEIFILEAIVVWILQIQLPEIPRPGFGLCKSLQGFLQVALGISELDLPIRRPGNPRSKERNLATDMGVNLQGVREEGIGNGSAGSNWDAIAIIGIGEGDAIGGGIFREPSKKLIIVPGLDVAPMILVEIAQAVIHENLAQEILLEREGNLTSAVASVILDDTGTGHGIIGAAQLLAVRVINYMLLDIV